MYIPAELSNYLGFSAATGHRYWEIHTIHSWNFSSSIRINPLYTKPIRPEKKNSKKLVVGLVLGGSGLACILVIGMTFLWFGFKREGKAVKNEENDVFMVHYEFENETGPKNYSYETLSTATKNFAESEKGSKQGIKEYASEVKIIGRLRHRNLVKLIGWCHEEKELLLVYEFMPNGSLDYHLFTDNMFLTWMTRYNIVRGLASSLLYLHEEWEQCVLHRDIKTSNVMLDSSFCVKLGDFGLARLVDHGKEIKTTVLSGTIGYMAPEYVMTSKASKETDVYSFGIVALEIASGRRPVNPKAKEGEVKLVEFVWSLYGQGKILEAADHKLAMDYDAKQLACLIIIGL
ncbi:putative Concanavalin A-like lectin protein kinase family protein [Heracleum sosnowskyi]|uniref:Concanavalin A-like lectin protein kinase family protein n=1 Tax=Heracleum sosnowskyi TaxID=360622 RepID=A0AAD8JE70_9APIA|nr:putative Concanavalin A-like lectin protein kinase family protein [Heracleum sosnowskyi]